MSSPIEILVTPLQYRTWEKFMYEICLVFHPNQNPGAANSSVIMLILIIILVLYEVNAYPNLKSKVRLCL